jgi:hypothetical protein
VGDLSVNMEARESVNFMKKLLLGKLRWTRLADSFKTSTMKLINEVAPLQLF